MDGAHHLRLCMNTVIVTNAPLLGYYTLHMLLCVVVSFGEA